MALPTQTTGDLITATIWNNVIAAVNAMLALLQPTEYNAGNTGTAITINFATNGPIQKATRNGNCTITLTAPTYPGTVILKLIHDATGSTYTVAFSPTPKWPSGTAFSFTNTASAVDILTLYWDGATWYVVGQADMR